jgi:hypothetical protein
MNESETTDPNPLFVAALELQIAIQQERWAFCFIGGLAVLRWGEIRMTQDIDICLLCGFGNERLYIHQLLSTFKSRLQDAETFAHANRVLLLQASNGVSVDVALSGLDFEDEMIKRATPFSFHRSCKLITASAEDLIVLKAFSDRSKDWMDVEGIIYRQGKMLDSDYIIRQLEPLCAIKGNSENVGRLQALMQSNK